MEKVDQESKINLLKGAKVSNIDFEGGKIEVNCEMKSYMWIFAADGAFSQTREQMVQQKGFSSSTKYGTLGYCEVIIKSDKLDRNALHYWPRHTFEIFAVPEKEH